MHTAQLTQAQLQVRAQPNPSSQFFNLIINSSNATPVFVKVVDAMGRTVETKTGTGINQTIRVGENNTPGVFFAEIMQGNERVVIQLIKQ
jgi:hypothetical protein